MNEITLTGRITAIPELKRTNSGKSVTSFTIAVKRPMVKDTTDFINCIAWGNTAEFVCKYGFKGQKALVKGCLTQRNYETNDGKTRSAFEVKVDIVEFFEYKQQETSDDNNYSYQPTENNQTTFEDYSGDDDLPF